MIAGDELGNDVVKDFERRNGARGVWESHWDEIADLLDPNMRQTLRFGDYRTPGERLLERQMTSIPTIALTQFGAIMDSLLTPRNSQWHRLVPSDPELAKDHSVKLFFEELNNRLFKARYAPSANFASNNQLVYRGLGSFGTAAMFVDRLSGGRGLRYKALHVGQIYPKENHQGIIDDVIRRESMTAEQVLRTPGWRDVLPDDVRKAAENDPNRRFTVLHRVRPRGQGFDPEALDHRAMKFESVYVLYEGRLTLEEGGYRSFPYSVTRYEQAPGEVYGRAPAMQCLAATRSANVMKRILLTQGHRAINPVLLVPDDGAINNVGIRPGHMIPGGMSHDGKRLIDTLPTGDHALNMELLNQDLTEIKSAFLTELFQILQETPRMTATEVLERTREKGILLAPTVGRQQSEYLGPMIDRELDLMAQMGSFPDLPPALREAAGDYEAMYDSPLSRAARAEEVLGFSRTMEMLVPILNAGRTEVLDVFKPHEVTRYIAEAQAVPPSLMVSPEEFAAIQQQRAQQQQAAMQAEAAPEMLKAAAAAKKAGVNAEDLQ